MAKVPFLKRPNVKRTLRVLALGAGAGLSFMGVGNLPMFSMDAFESVLFGATAPSRHGCRNTARRRRTSRRRNPHRISGGFPLLRSFRFLYSQRFTFSIRLRRSTPRLQRQQQTCRFTIRFTLRSRHVAHTRQKRRPARVVASLDRSSQVRARVSRLIRAAPLLIQPTSSVLTFFALPRLRSHQ